MPEFVILLSIPGLRRQDVAAMPHLTELVGPGQEAQLVPSFPCLGSTVQANMLTGATPHEHGVVAASWFDRGAEHIAAASAARLPLPTIWDVLHQHNPATKCAVWLPRVGTGQGADYVLFDAFADRDSRQLNELVDSAVAAAQQYQPNFFFLTLSHLEPSMKLAGPDSAAAAQAVQELDAALGRLIAGFGEAYGHRGTGGTPPLWLVASEYTIVPVAHVLFPNRVLREAGRLSLRRDELGRETLDLSATAAWALVEQQCGHVYVRNRDAATIKQVVELFAGRDGIDEVLVGCDRGQYQLDHEHAGDVVLVSSPTSWQADEQTHRPEDAARIKGSHGAPANDDRQRGVLLSSQPGVFEGPPLADSDVFDLVLRQFGI